MTVDAKTWYDWSEGAGLGLMLAAIFSLPGYQIDWRLVLLCDLSCLALGTTLNLYTGVKALRRVNVVAMIVLMVRLFASASQLVAVLNVMLHLTCWQS